MVINKMTNALLSVPLRLLMIVTHPLANDQRHRADRCLTFRECAETMRLGPQTLVSSALLERCCVAAKGVLPQTAGFTANRNAANLRASFFNAARRLDVLLRVRATHQHQQASDLPRSN